MARHTLLLRRTLRTLFCVSLLFTFFSCDDIQELEQEVVAPVSHSANRYPVTFSLEKSLAKSVLPIRIEEETLSFKLIAYPTSNNLLLAIDESDQNVTSVFREGKQYPTLTALSGECLYLDAGSWTFKLYAYKNPDVYQATATVENQTVYTYDDEYADDYLVLKDENETVDFGANNTTVSFTMVAADTGTGSINLSLHCYLGSGTSSTITAVTGTLYNTDGSEISDGWAQGGSAVIAESSATDTTSGEVYWPVTYTNASVPKGTYLLTCKFTLSYDHDSNSATPKQTIDSFYMTSVTVEPGSISKATKVTDSGETVVEDVDIRNLKQRYTVTYMNVNDETGKIEPFPTEFWVNKTAMVTAGKFSYNPSSNETFTLPTIADIKRTEKCFVGWYERYTEPSDGSTVGTYITPGSDFVGETGSKTYYAKWRDLTLYVAASGTKGTHYSHKAGSASGIGTKDSPYATLDAAVSFIKSNPGNLLPWQIYIDGAVSGTTLSAIVANKVTISGYSADTNETEVEDVLRPAEASSSVIRVTTAVPVTIESLTITDGSGTEGAGLNIGSLADVTLKNVTVSGNSTLENTEQNGGGILNGGTLRLDGCTITDNTASGFGGGVFNQGTLYIYGSTVIGASDDGSTVIGASDAGNSAKAGGGIYNFGSGAVYIGYTSASVNASADFTGSISYNNATGTATEEDATAGSGGGIFNLGTCIIDASATAAISFNAAGTNGNGGGIWSNGTLTVNGTTLRANTAPSGNGGAIYNAGTLTVNGTTEITGNLAEAGNGGGIYSEGSLTINAGTVTNNKAQKGAGVYNNISADSPVFTMTGGTISNNIATVSGGGVYNESGTFTLSGGAIGAANNANTAPRGGGVYNAGTFNMTNGEIAYNTAIVSGTVNGNGGGVYNAEGSFTMSGGSITKNSAGTTTSDDDNVSTESLGGGVFNAQGATMEVSSSAIIGQELGASNTITADNCANYANCYGGGIYNAGSLTLSGSDYRITGNFASTGGGIYTTSTLDNTSNVTNNGAEVSNGKQVKTVTTP